MVFFKAINTLSTFLMLSAKKENAKTLATHRCELAKTRKLRAKHSQTEQFNIYIRPGRLSTFYWSVKWGNYLWNPHTQLAAHFSFNCLHHLLINSRNSIYFNAETTKFHSLFVLIGRWGVLFFLSRKNVEINLCCVCFFDFGNEICAFTTFGMSSRKKKTRKTAAFPQLRVFSTGEKVRIV